MVLYIGREYARIARGRASEEFNKSMWELGELARQHDVRLIYRNNHFNFRFGAHCADDRIEKALEGIALLKETQ